MVGFIGVKRAINNPGENGIWYMAAKVSASPRYQRIFLPQPIASFEYKCTLSPRLNFYPNEKRLTCTSNPKLQVLGTSLSLRNRGVKSRSPYRNRGGGVPETKTCPRLRRLSTATG